MKEIQDNFKIRYIFYTIYGWGLFAVVFAVLFLIFAPICLLLCLFGIDKKRKTIIWSIKLACKTFFFLFIGHKIILKNNGVGKMKKGEKRMYLINHSSIYDVILAYVLPGASRFVIKDKWMKKPFVGWIQHLAGNVVVGEDKPENHQIADSEPDSIQETVKAFEQEMPIIVFPEGTRSKNGQIQRFKRGAFKIALTGHVDIVPVVMDDWNCVRPIGAGVWIRDIHPHITILPAIKYEQYKHLTHAELAKLMRFIMTKKLYEMREERKTADKKDYRHAAKFVEEDKKVKESLDALEKELKEKNIELVNYSLS